MIIKVVYYVGGTDHNVMHDRVIEVYDFHIETLSKESQEEEEGGIHELIYQTNQGGTGTLRLGRHPKHSDHLYVMENGKTVDHMVFNSN